MKKEKQGIISSPRKPSSGLYQKKIIKTAIEMTKQQIYNLAFFLFKSVVFVTHCSMMCEV